MLLEGGWEKARRLAVCRDRELALVSWELQWVEVECSATRVRSGLLESELEASEEKIQ